MILLAIILIICAYLLGNLSPATILAKASGHNIKEEGSGNAGTTNVLRIVGPKAAIITLIVDLAKGFIATKLGLLLGMVIFEYNVTGSQYSLYMAYVLSAICGVASFFGHVWPVLLGFKGGKGVATALGVLLATDWRIALICLCFFLVVVALTKMVSLGSILAAILFLIIYIFATTKGYTTPFANSFIRFQFGTLAGWLPLILPYLIMVVVLIVKHRSNIERILKGEENKLSFKKSKENNHE